MNERFDPQEFAGQTGTATVTDGSGAARPAARRGRGRLMLMIVVAIALAGGGLAARQWWTVGRFIESTEDAYVKADIAQVAAQVGGRVAQLAVTANQRVAAGDVLLRIEPSDYKAAVATAKARMARARAARARHERQIALQQTRIAAAQADLASARATLDFARADYQRYTSLAEGTTVPERRVQATRRDFEAAKAAVAGAEAALQAARGQLAVLESERALRAAEVAEAEAALQAAQLNLEHTVIRAPNAGTVANIGVRRGEVIGTGQALFSLVPLSQVYVNANFKETQIADFQPGMAATIRSDMLNGRAFKGHIDSISPAAGQEFALLPPQNATGNFTKITQRVTVRIALDEAPGGGALALRPGTSVIAAVNTKNAAAGQ